MAGTGMTAEELEADKTMTAKEAADAEAAAAAAAEREAKRKTAAAAAAAAAAAGDGDDEGKGAEEGEGGEGEEGGDGEGDGGDGDSIGPEVRYTVGPHGERMPQKSFVPRKHGVVPPRSDPALLSGYDYSEAFAAARVTGKVLCMFAANPNPVDALEWIFRRMGLSGLHRRVIVEDFIKLAKCTWLLHVDCVCGVMARVCCLLSTVGCSCGGCSRSWWRLCHTSRVHFACVYVRACVFACMCVAVVLQCAQMTKASQKLWRRPHTLLGSGASDSLSFTARLVCTCGRALVCAPVSNMFMCVSRVPQVYVNKFMTFAAVRQTIVETPGLKWALPEQCVDCMCAARVRVAVVVIVAVDD